VLKDSKTNYCCVTESYAELVRSPLRSRGFKTKLSDEEVMMEIVGEFMGKENVDIAIMPILSVQWIY